jgi:protein-disulfide isomerase
MPPMPKPKDETVKFELKKHQLFGFVGLIAGILLGYMIWGSGAIVPKPAEVASQDAGSGLGGLQPTATVVGDIVARRYEIPINEDDPILGADDAPITIVEFADFQCPFCQRHFLETYPLLVENYGDQIRFVYKDYPLTSIHPEAIPSALAAKCAQEQDKFWEFHDLLYSGRLELGDEAYLTYAEELELDMAGFQACYDEARYTEAVQADYNFGAQLGVNSTPTFFINGIAVVGAQPFSVFAQVIDYELGNQEN